MIKRMIKAHPIGNRMSRQATRSWPNPQATRAAGESTLFSVDQDGRIPDRSHTRGLSGRAGAGPPA
jgi:hypothetical protein